MSDFVKLRLQLINLSNYIPKASNLSVGSSHGSAGARGLVDGASLGLDRKLQRARDQHGYAERSCMVQHTCSTRFCIAAIKRSKCCPRTARLAGSSTSLPLPVEAALAAREVEAEVRACPRPRVDVD